MDEDLAVSSTRTAALTRARPTAVADAHRQLRDLVAVARTLLPHVDDLDLEDDPGPLGQHPFGPALVAAVPRLAALDVAAEPFGSEAPAELVAEFERRLVDAADTVRWCRRTAHPGHACWFRSAQGGGCADVLRLAHDLAAARS